MPRPCMRCSSANPLWCTRARLYRLCRRLRSAAARRAARATAYSILTDPEPLLHVLADAVQRLASRLRLPRTHSPRLTRPSCGREARRRLAPRLSPIQRLSPSVECEPSLVELARVDGSTVSAMSSPSLGHTLSLASTSSLRSSVLYPRSLVEYPRFRSSRRRYCCFPPSRRSRPRARRRRFPCSSRRPSRRSSARRRPPYVCFPISCRHC